MTMDTTAEAIGHDMTVKQMPKSAPKRNFDVAFLTGSINREESSEDDGDVEAPTTTTTTTSKATGGAIEPMEIDTTTTTIKPRY